MDLPQPGVISSLALLVPLQVLFGKLAQNLLSEPQKIVKNLVREGKILNTDGPGGFLFQPATVDQLVCIAVSGHDRQLLEIAGQGIANQELGLAGQALKSFHRHCCLRLNHHIYIPETRP